jgi:hypothetical protein
LSITVETIHSVARARFNTLVASPLSLPVAWDNAPFDEPDDALWARVAVRLGSPFRPTSDRYRQPGQLIASIYAPLEGGDQASWETADVVVAAFRAVTASGVKFLVPRATSVGRSGRWWQTNVACPFRADDVIV